MLIKLARLSVWNRRATVLLTLLALSISIALVLGIDHLRNQAKESFSKTLSGTDLIVGARSGSINLLLYSVFRIGNATNNITWQTYQELAKHSGIDWIIPISLGDSHRGYRVLGTNDVYFAHYQFGQHQPLVFTEGKKFEEVYDAVLGAEVAQKLGYKLGDKIVVAHGSSEVTLSKHNDKPFTVVGILQPTGTPVDRTVHVSLAAIEAIHLDWQGGVQTPSHKISAEEALKFDLTPTAITAMLVGLKSRAQTFSVQRQINEYSEEPLLAILPGVALTELWSMLAMVENLLTVISIFVLIAALMGMTTSLLSAMNERQREIAILRSLGASAGYLFLLVELEVFIITVLALLLGTGVLSIGLAFGQHYLAQQFGLFVPANPIQSYTPIAACGVILLSLVLGSVPAFIAYRRALGEGLSQRL
ncbi:MAG: ABC transporter permease [Gammaproteobacteria bacterium]|nr:MAG: ABC transporter permease [Gammaproteobacteria bacterium]